MAKNERESFKADGEVCVMFATVPFQHDQPLSLMMQL